MFTDYESSTQRSVSAFVSGGSLTFHVRDGSNTNHEITYPVENNTWYHGAFSWNNTDMLLYVDGTKVNFTTKGSGLDQSARPLYVGSRETETYYYTGALDEMLIYDRVLSSEEVLQLYNGYFNSVNITFRDADTNSLVSNVNVTVVNATSTTLYTVTGSNLFLNGLGNGNHTITAIASDYESSTRILELTQQENNLTMYLHDSDNVLSRQFIVKDVNTQQTLGGTVLQFNKTIGSNIITVTELTTDFTGQVVVNLNPVNTYGILAKHTNYDPKFISLQPVLSSYIITLGVFVQPDFETTTDNLEYSIDPVYSILHQNETYEFNFSIDSYLGELDYWGMNVTHNGTEQSIFSTDADGGKAFINVTTAINTTAILSLNVTYFWGHQTYGPQQLDKKYWVYPETPTNNTIGAVFAAFTEGLDTDSDNLGLVVGIIVTLSIIALLGMLISFGVTDIDLLSFVAIVFLAFWSMVGMFSWLLWSMFAIPYILIKILRAVY
jgi:hypothetical protein